MICFFGMKSSTYFKSLLAEPQKSVRIGGICIETIHVVERRAWIIMLDVFVTNAGLTQSAF